MTVESSQGTAQSARNLSLTTVATLVSIGVALPALGYVSVATPLVLAGYPVAASVAIDPGVAAFRGASVLMSAGLTFGLLFALAAWPRLVPVQGSAVPPEVGQSNDLGGPIAIVRRVVSLARAQHALEGNWGPQSRRAVADAVVMFAVPLIVGAVLLLLALVWLPIVPISLLPPIVVGAFIGFRWGSRDSRPRFVTRHAIAITAAFGAAAILAAVLSPVTLWSSDLRLDPRAGLPDGLYVVIGSTDTWTYLSTCDSPATRAVATSLVWSITEPSPRPPSSLSRAPSLSEIVSGRAPFVQTCDGRELHSSP